MKNHSIDCRECTARLPLFVGGELAGAARAEVETHLGACVACAQQSARIHAARESLRAGLSRGLASSPNLWPGVRAGLIQDGLLVPALGESSRPRARFELSRRAAAYAAAATVLLSLGVWWFERSAGGGATDHSALPIARNMSSPSSPLVVQPVGLRRVPLGEAPLSESAEVYTEEWNRGEYLPSLHPSPSIEAAGLRAVPNVRQH
jgi:hypothetical protein